MARRLYRLAPACQGPARSSSQRIEAAAGVVKIKHVWLSGQPGIWTALTVAPSESVSLPRTAIWSRVHGSWLRGGAAGASPELVPTPTIHAAPARASIAAAITNCLIISAAAPFVPPGGTFADLAAFQATLGASWLTSTQISSATSNTWGIYVRDITILTHLSGSTRSDERVRLPRTNPRPVQNHSCCGNIAIKNAATRTPMHPFG